MTIANNTSKMDGSFMVSLASTGGVFKNNQGCNFGGKGVKPVSIPSGPTHNADAAVDLGPGNEFLVVSDNDLEEGEGSISNGIAFTNVFGSGASELVTVKDNTIKGFPGNGIVAEADPLAVATVGRCSIVGNEVKDNGQDGIYIDSLSVKEARAVSIYVFTYPQEAK
jgi:hypothetical protein